MKIKKVHFVLYFLSTFLVLLLPCKTNAVVIDGMVRLFRGEGDFDDSVNGYDLDQTWSTSSTPTLNAGVTFPYATPYGTQARQVMNFPRQGKKHGDATGLPTGNQSRSMAGWVRWDGSYNGWIAMFGYGTTATTGAYYVHLQSNLKLEMDIWGADEGMNPILPDVFTSNVWYHIVITWDGTNNRAYVNGHLVKTGTATSPNTQLGRVVLGGSPSFATYWHLDSSSWAGDLADVAFFNRALTDAEVSSIYNAPEGLRAPAALGETCSNASDCSSGYCAGNECVDGGIGSTCDLGENADCASNYCGGNGLCTDGSNGSSCTDVTSCSSGYCAGNECVDGGIGSTCDLGENADCASNYCGGDGLCTDGSIGSVCTAGSSCSSGYCAGNECVDGGIGSTCDLGENADCASNYCGGDGLCTDGSIGSVCTAGSSCSSGSCAGNNQCTDGALSSPCGIGTDCNLGYCVSNQCTDGALSSLCASGNDCSSGFCGGGTCSDGANGAACGNGSDCSSGYCTISGSCANPPILDPCHGITCSNHGKCKGNGICQCEDTFIQIKDGKDCACPDGTFLHASPNRCYAPTSTPTLSPVSSPVTLSPTSAPVTTVPTPDTPLEDSCEDSTDTFFVNDKEISCIWLSRNKKREQKRKDVYCALNEVKMACPLTCDFCDCIDDASYTFQLKSGTDGINCSWISKNKRKIDKRRAKYCTDDYDDGALVNACTESCGLCAN